MRTAIPDQLRELFSAMDGVRIRRMFGGFGVYRDGIMFALVAEAVVYLKADQTTENRFKAEGCGPFVYEAKGRPVVMSYWRLPERLYDEPNELREWMNEACAVAARSQLKKLRKSRRGGWSP